MKIIYVENCKTCPYIEYFNLFPTLCSFSGHEIENQFIIDKYCELEEYLYDENNKLLK